MGMGTQSKPDTCPHLDFWENPNWISLKELKKDYTTC
jgi:hypothetical protein